MISETDTRNQKTMKWCNKCGKVFQGTEGEHEPLCKKCAGDEE